MKNLVCTCILAGAMSLLPSETTKAVQKVPISFDQFHGYTGTVNYLKAVNKAYPDITELIEIGQSSQKRPIYVLQITNKKTGTTLDREKTLVYERKLEVPVPFKTTLDQGKAGHMLTGATHGNEQTGTEVCLYFIDKMVSGYKDDPEITKLIDTKVFYVCPANNPDGLFNTGEKGIAQRTNSMYQDTARNVFRKDLNNVAIYSPIRYNDDKGMFRLCSLDTRVMELSRTDDDYKAER